MTTTDRGDNQDPEFIVLSSLEDQAPEQTVTLGHKCSMCTQVGGFFCENILLGSYGPAMLYILISLHFRS